MRLHINNVLIKLDLYAHRQRGAWKRTREGLALVFFLTYLRRELRRRMRRAIFIALGLALGAGLVVTVAAASAGFKKAQSGVLSALYGWGPT